MLLEALIDDIQDTLEDPGGLATFPDAVVAKAAESACRFVGNNVGRNTTRLAIDMSDGVADYDIPIANKIRRINQVKIIPENGNEPRSQGIIQIDLIDLPLTLSVQSGRDPDRFVLQLTGGTAENQYQLTLWPTPGRTALNAIVVDAEIDYVFDVADQATTNVAYPEQFDEVIKYLACYFLLFTKDNANDQNQAVRFKAAAEEILEQNRPVDAITKSVSRRMFP